MKNHALTVYYNSSQVTPAQGLSLIEGGYHTAAPKLDQTVLNSWANALPEQAPIVVVDAQSERPPFWLERLSNVAALDEDVQVVSALTSHRHALSPVTAEHAFEGQVSDLDAWLALLQTPSYFSTRALNPHCFWVRDAKQLKQVLSDEPKHAINHLLVQPPETPVQLHEVVDVGDQNPLPSHPLAAFHLRLNDLEPPLSAYPRFDDKPVVLHVTMSWGGGVHKWINDFIHHHPQYHHLVWVSGGELYRHSHGEQFHLHWQSTEGPVLATHHMSLPIEATAVHHQDYRQALQRIINTWSISGVVVSSLIGHAMDCLDTGLPTLRVMHDYFPHWPALSARLDGKVNATTIDEALAQTAGEPFGLLDRTQWQHWKEAHNKRCGQPHVTVVAPSQSVLKNLMKIEPCEGLSQGHVLPHGIDPLPAVEAPTESPPFKVLVLGRINPPKGQVLLDGLLERLKEQNDIEFIFLGAGNEGKKYLPDERITVVMDYPAESLATLLQQHQPHVALITANTSETFSYALSELQAANIPVVSTPMGALLERIEGGVTGFLVEPEVEKFAAKLLELKDKPEQLNAVRQALKTRSPDDVGQAMQRYKAVFAPQTASKKTHWQPLVVPEWVSQVTEAKGQAALDHHRWLQSEQDLADKKAWVAQLQQHVAHLSENIELNKQQEQHLLNTIDELKVALDDNEARHVKTQQDLNQVIDEQSGQIEQVKNELSAVYQSRSWRMTRPMRRFTTWARHKRNALKFRWAQIKSWPKRGLNSLRSRGLVATAKLAANKLKKPPIPATVKPLATQPTQDYQPLQVPKSDKPKVSIIIPVYNHFEHTYHCLKSLSQIKDSTPFEVIVIDDCSTDDTEALIQQVTGIHYHRQLQNGGFIESCNTGASLAQGEFLLFLNNDTEVHDDGIDALVKTFDTHPDAGLVGSQLIYPDGRLQEAGGIVFSDASGWNYGRLDDPNKPAYQHVRAVSYCSGASILIRRALFESLGRFDERYKPAYYEDTDLAFAVRQAGHQVYYQPASRVTHFEGVSSGTDLTSGTKKYQVINQEKFLDKWRTTLNEQPESGSDIERSRFQNQPKRVLIFDACTPTPDQDSGSLRMMNLMIIFKQLGHQVTFIPENMAHFDQYTSQLQQLGVECIYAPTFSSPIEYLSSHGVYFDVVLLSRYYVAEPLMPMIRQYCPEAQLLFDTVDLHYLREERMAEVANNAAQIKAAAVTKQKELAVARACDTTLVVSPYEQSVLAKEFPDLDVQILSNIHEVYGRLKGYQARKDLVFMGGYQHTPNVDGLLWFIDDIWPIIQRALPEVQLHVVGSKAPPQIEALGVLDGVVYHGFVEDIEPVMCDYRIAIAPLRFGAGVKGKVNMSMSYGQPVVGTAVAVEGMYTTHGQDVMMSDDPESFAEHVIELYQDSDLWHRISDGGLKNVAQWFSFEAAKKQIQHVLK